MNSLSDVWLMYRTCNMLQVGFDSLYFARMDYQDREKRKNEKTLEFVWRGSKSLGSSSQVMFCLLACC